MEQRRARRTRRERALLVDLDDTLFDHRRSYRAGLDALRNEFPSFRRRSMAWAARRYQELLDRWHPAVIRGEVPLAEARRRRFAQLLQEGGVELRPGELERAIAISRAAYDANQRAVRGAPSLLRALHPEWAIVVVTNHQRSEQLAKLATIGLDPWIDGLVSSDEAKVLKPDRRPFDLGLGLAGVGRDHAVVLGDSWESDILGALSVGIRPVWLNRDGRPAPAPGVRELRSLVPISKSLAAVRGDP